MGDSALNKTATDGEIRESMTNQQEQLLDRLTGVDETSRRLAVSSFTVRRLIKSKRLRAVRVAKRLLIPESEIARVIAEGCSK